MIDTSLESGAASGGGLLISLPISHSICLCLHLFLGLSILLRAQPHLYIYKSVFQHLYLDIHRLVLSTPGWLYKGVYICPSLYFIYFIAVFVLLSLDYLYCYLHITSTRLLAFAGAWVHAPHHLSLSPNSRLILVV